MSGVYLCRYERLSRASFQWLSSLPFFIAYEAGWWGDALMSSVFPNWGFNTFICSQQINPLAGILGFSYSDVRSHLKSFKFAQLPKPIPMWKVSNPKRIGQIPSPHKFLEFHQIMVVFFPKLIILSPFIFLSLWLPNLQQKKTGGVS